MEVRHREAVGRKQHEEHFQGVQGNAFLQTTGGVEYDLA